MVLRRSARSERGSAPSLGCAHNHLEQTHARAARAGEAVERGVDLDLRWRYCLRSTAARLSIQEIAQERSLVEGPKTRAPMLWRPEPAPESTRGEVDCAPPQRLAKVCWPTACSASPVALDMAVVDHERSARVRHRRSISSAMLSARHSKISPILNRAAPSAHLLEQRIDRALLNCSRSR